MASSQGQGDDGGQGSRGGGGDGQQGARIASLMSKHFTAEDLGRLDLTTPAGLASLTAILGQALQTGLDAGEAYREQEEKAKAVEKENSKKRKREERAKQGVLSPAAQEKKRRKEERDELRKKRDEQRKKEEARRKLPMLILETCGIPTELAYTGAKSTIKHIWATNFPRGVMWGKLTREEQKQCMNQVKDAFRNGADLDEQWLADKISNSMSQARYHDRMKIRAHLASLEDYRNLRQPLQFIEDMWNAFYKVEVQIKASKTLLSWQE